MKQAPDSAAAPAEPECDVSVVLPVYNEAAHLSDELDRITEALDRSSYSWEVIVVDDGSSDGSGDLALGRPGVRLLRSARNRGCGAARRIGTLAAKGRVVVWSDADMTYPNHEISALVDDLGDADQLVGARTTEQGTLKALRIPAKWVIRRLAGYLARTRIPDLNSGFRAMRRDVAEQFVRQIPDGFSCVTTITMLFLMNGYSVRYKPIDYRPRSGRSKFHWWVDTRRYLLQILRMMLSHDPLRVFMPLTAVLGAAFAVKLGYDLTGKDFRVAANTLLLGFAAGQALAVGLIADLMVRTSRTSQPSRLVAPADTREITTNDSSYGGASREE
ncbi:MAG: glycosyltransferase family 2 protein [Acidimicrobiaceae bacterium]|nr:glycosyltransferase family 2 protein [Acidimicrobiaceae bacterium]MCY4175178.1 glycosyltransferase family 2 protein [Acidimicrobiaceae bacterium]MCY4279441.1 glycosyltransferase family 2 protein [Acidimicrobiaceae bacterium]MCY4294725.1 glycosyltransferase family 2 protein [Acidimicrobiaceae bacterium]